MSRPADVEVISLSSDDSDEGAPAAPGPSRPLAHHPGPRVAVGPFAFDVPHALDDASRAQFHAAIATAPEERVREAFAALVDYMPAVPERVFSMLVAVRGLDEVAPSQQQQQQQQQRGRVVMMRRWEICENCGEEFDAGEEREEDECCFHPGQFSSADEEAFEDWDDDVHGPKDTEENRRQYPENFIWTCCDEIGTHPGCVEQEHEAGDAQRRKKRARR
ncbi:hypothetical protein BV20DRAFT_995082 [Pilatotrama ljubarskyi]|nr:hypothetical protein BV20DRAFT_995082 [Pilatotrama ljubarskyi]